MDALRHIRGSSRRSFLWQSTAVLTSAVLRTPSPPQPLRTRRVWLRLLLDQVQDHLRAKKPLTEAQQFLAGLTRVQFLYVDEPHGDLILEGPAEARWDPQPDGSVLGQETGQPLLQLEDLAVAWRNAFAMAPPPSVSLEARPESQQRLQAFLRGAGHPKTAEERRRFAEGLQDAWGEQEAVTGGVPLRTRFNQVMIAADWDMKRISLGHAEAGPAKFPSYVDLEFSEFRRQAAAGPRKNPGGSRFWFYPAYAEFLRSEESDAVAIPEDAVQLLTESHFRNLAQGRQVLAEPSPAAKEFARRFTVDYPAIADTHPVYADLRNLFDWVAVARLARMLEVPRRIGYDFAVLRSALPQQDVEAPATMTGLVAVRHGTIRTDDGQFAVVFPAWGGVSMAMEHCALRADRSLRDRSHQARAARPSVPGMWYSTLPG